MNIYFPFLLSSSDAMDKSAAEKEVAQMIIDMELTLLRELKCHLTVYHPFRPLRALFDKLVEGGAKLETGAAEEAVRKLAATLDGL